MDTFRKVLRSKIHKATVTHADLNYEGSITISPELMEAAGLVEYEAVHVWNVTAGSRFETYVITGKSGSREIAVNGAAARLVSPGDKVIIACFQHISEESLPEYHPMIVFVDDQNRMKPTRREIPGPMLV